MKTRFAPARLAVAIAMASVAGSASAAIVGTQTSNGSSPSIAVGTSQVNAGPHTDGKAGIGVSSFSGGQKVDFQGLSLFSGSTSLGSGMTAYTLHDPITPGTPGDPNDPPHNGLGSFNFVKVGSGDVWFGEWSTNGNTGSPTYQNRQVYYAGEKAGYTPATGTAVGYTLTGVHRYGANTHLTGSLTANFTTRQFNGDLSIGATLIRLGTSTNRISFDTNGHFDAANAGQWLALGSMLVATGDVKGDFFGAGATAVAGIVDFHDNNLNIAWGGTKNP